MVICMEQGADLHMAQQIPLPLTVSCFSEIQIVFTFLVLAHLGSPGKKAVKLVCVCVCVRACVCDSLLHYVTSVQLSLTTCCNNRRVVTKFSKSRVSDNVPEGSTLIFRGVHIFI